MPRGIASDISGKAGGSRYIRHIRLRDDGEFCRLWFLTEGDEIFLESFHNIDNPGSGPKWLSKICVNSAFGQACEYCEEGSARTEFLAWTYELLHFYPDKPDNVETKKATIGSGRMYVEEVNEIRLMRASIMHRGSIKTRMERHGTLLDRPFDWIRDGKKGSKRPSYTLEALDVEKMTKELRELMETLPDLEDVALGKVERLGGASDDEKEGSEPSKKYATRTVSFEKDDDDEEGNEFVKEVAKSKKPQLKRNEEPDDDEDGDEDPFS